MKPTGTLAAVALFASLASGCAVFDKPVAEDLAQLDGAVQMAALTLPPPGQIEPIHAAAIAQDQAVFWVSSNGCTTKDDITPVVRSSTDGSIISLRRVNVDRCQEAKPQGVEVRWSFEELGLRPGARLSVDSPYQLTGD